MNCNIFHHKIYDLIEEDCLIDLKNSMEEHRDNCESCKAYYEKELEINKDFNKFFSIDGIDFKSSRVEIINAINKNQYKNNYFTGIYTHFNRYKKKYITWVAVFIIIFLGTTKLLKVDKINISFKGFSNAKTSTASQSVKNAPLLHESRESTTDNSTKDIVKDPKSIAFEKLELRGDQEIIYRDTWKTSSDGKYSACLDGKVTKIYVKENNTGKLWSFAINNDSNRQYTPIFLEWSQKSYTLMVTIDKNGYIYELNLDSAIAKLTK